MVMVLEVEMVHEIARIGRSRAPNEACGLLFPYAVRGRSVWELPNRSLKPLDSFEMRGEDMAILLEQLFDGDLPLIQKLVPTLTAWHTHPSGNLGPSLFDLQNKPAHIKSLVVTLSTEGQPLATWY
jgi:proteasome lid subunit RPN8/RPN11